MRSQLRLASALGCQETESDHFPLLQVKTRSRIVIAETVVRQPAVDVSALPGFPHLLAEDLCLCIHTFLKTVLHGRGGLARQRQFYAPLCEHLIDRMKKRQHPSHAEVIHRLINHFLNHYRRKSGVKGLRQNLLKCIHTLASGEGCQNRQISGGIVQLLSRLVDYLIQRKVIIAFHKFRIGFI